MLLVQQFFAEHTGAWRWVSASAVKTLKYNSVSRTLTVTLLKQIWAVNGVLKSYSSSQPLESSKHLHMLGCQECFPGSAKGVGLEKNLWWKGLNKYLKNLKRVKLIRPKVK
jgi:hypothetical protein